MNDCGLRFSFLTRRRSLALPLCPREDAPRLLQMLQASWGQSRVLELALNDYIAAYDPATGTADMRHQVPPATFDTT